MKYKNIIFDLGGVLFDIDYLKTEHAFKNLGLINFDEIYSKKKQQYFFDNFEKGLMTSDDFRIEIKSHFDFPVTDKQIDDAWNAMLIGVPVPRYEWLAEIAKHHRIFLLSNTNDLHVAAFSEMIEKDFGIKKFEQIFEKVYYSCEMGMRKPDAEIFNHVVTENNLALAETLFIDDSPQHVEGARKYGLTALHLVDSVKIEDLFIESLTR